MPNRTGFEWPFVFDDSHDPVTPPPTRRIRRSISRSNLDGAVIGVYTLNGTNGLCVGLHVRGVRVAWVIGSIIKVISVRISIR